MSRRSISSPDDRGIVTGAVGTPIEASIGKERELTITYREFGMLKKIEQAK